MAQRVIAITRDFGSGGRAIGLALAEKLGIPFYDKGILNQVAENQGLNKDFVNQVDRKGPSIPAPIFGRSMVATFYQPTFSDQIFIDQSNIIKELASKGPCVIVGRCADYILRDTDAVKVYITAGMKHKIERKRAVDEEVAGASDEQIEKYIRDIDKRRSKYYEHFTGQKKGDALNYDLCIRSDEIGTDGAVNTIIEYLKGIK